VGKITKYVKESGERREEEKIQMGRRERREGKVEGYYQYTKEKGKKEEKVGKRQRPRSYLYVNREIPMRRYLGLEHLN